MNRLCFSLVVFSQIVLCSWKDHVTAGTSQMHSHCADWRTPSLSAKYSTQSEINHEACFVETFSNKKHSAEVFLFCMNMMQTAWILSVSMNAPEGLEHAPQHHQSSASAVIPVCHCAAMWESQGRHMASGWQAGSLTMCLAVKICPGSYSVSVLECADVGERKGREGRAEGGGMRVEGWGCGLT